MLLEEDARGADVDGMYGEFVGHCWESRRRGQQGRVVHVEARVEAWKDFCRSNSCVNYVQAMVTNLAVS